jgi:ribosomal protein S18 acetylase RimI-like enzyme
MTDIIECNISDVNLLKELSILTFRESYSHNNDPVQFEIYISQAFTAEKLLTELQNTNSRFYLILNNSEVVGYLKLNFAAAQTDINDDDSIEIERIYLLKSHQRKGIGSLILDFVEKLAIAFNKSYIWLGVWDENLSAIAFYKAKNFLTFGQHTFTIGNIDQIDILLKKQV